MKKILKITLVVLSLVSVLFLTILPASAEGSNTYGFVAYNPVTSDGVVKDKMNMPIIIDPLIEYYGTSSAKRFQTYNFSGDFARWRLILPDIGAKAFVSSSKNVRLHIGVEYTRQQLFDAVNSVTDRVFMLPAVYNPSGGILDDFGTVYVWVYRYNSSEDIYTMAGYDFTLHSNLELTLSSLGISLDETNDVYGFSIDWVPDPSLDCSDLTVWLPLDYSPLEIDISYLAQTSYNSGVEEGFEEGFDFGVNVSDDPVGLRAIFTAVQSFLNLEIMPGVKISLILECLFAVLIVSIIAKLVAGG